MAERNVCKLKNHILLNYIYFLCRWNSTQKSHAKDTNLNLYKLLTLKWVDEIIQSYNHWIYRIVAKFSLQESVNGNIYNGKT